MNPILQINGRAEPLRGTFAVPGDKSISHRALFFATFRSDLQIRNLAPGDDVLRTRRLIESAGYRVEESERGVRVFGAPDRPDAFEHSIRIDCGNSGTTARMGLGWLTGERGLWKVTGDESLRRRPMGRVIEPLERLGASFRGGRTNLPVSVIADQRVIGGTEEWIGSAQVHAGLLLAGLRSEQGIRLRRMEHMRDHTLRLARRLHLPVESDDDLDTVHPVAAGLPSPESTDPSGFTLFDIPGDISSASFLIAAALLQPDADITIRGVGLNPTRIAFLEAVRSMGGDISWEITKGEWEPSGDVRVRGGAKLRGDDFSAESIDVVGMADEIPLLVLIAAHARGRSRIRDVAELRVKESDRISSTVAILNRLGFDVQERGDGFEIAGRGTVRGGVDIDPMGDHRLAMLAGVAGTVALEPVRVTNPEIASVSWPGFWDLFGK